MRPLLLLCLAFLLAETLAFGYSNYQLPKRQTRRESHYKTLYRTTTILGSTVSPSGIIAPLLNVPLYRDTQCADKNQCASLNKVMPLWQFRANPLNTFKPLNGQVLIAFDQDDDGNAVNAFGQKITSNNGDAGLDQSTSTMASLYTGIVVSASADVLSQNLTEGARVYFSQRCTVRWTAVTYAATYGPTENALSMEGKFKNGVDLNNAEGWQFTRPTYDTDFPYTSSFSTLPGTSFAWPDGTTYPNADTEFYPGYAGKKMSTTAFTDLPAAPTSPSRPEGTYSFPSTPNPGLAGEAGQDADTPPQNPNQQSNYLLCLETDIFGVVKEAGFPNLEARQYIKPETVFRGMKTPFSYNKYAEVTANSPAAVAAGAFP